MGTESMIPLGTEIIKALGSYGKYFLPSRMVAKTAFVNMAQDSNLTIDDAWERTDAIMDFDSVIKAKQDKNVMRVLSHASSSLDGKLADNPFLQAEEIEEDWLLDFMERIRNVSDDEIQKLWGRIMAEKAIGTRVSKQLLRVLYEIEHEEAMLFTRLVSYTLMIHYKDGTKSPIPALINEKESAEKTTRSEVIKRLINLGLLENSTSLINPSKIQRIFYYNQGFNYEDYYLVYQEAVKGTLGLETDPQFDNINQVPFCTPSIAYTPVGEELYSIIKTEPLTDYFEQKMNEYYEEQCVKATIFYGRGFHGVEDLKGEIDLPLFFIELE